MRNKLAFNRTLLIYGFTSVLAVFSLLLFGVLIAFTQPSQTELRVVEAAHGRQVAFQQMALFTTQLVHAEEDTERAAIRESLLAAAQVFEDYHAQIAALNDLMPLQEYPELVRSPQITARLDELLPLVRAFAESEPAEQTHESSSYTELMRLFQGDLAALLDQRSSVYEGYALTRIQRAQQLEMIFAAIVVALIVFQAIFVIRPVLNQQQRENVSLRAEVEAQKKLDEVQARLASIVETSEDAIISKTLEGVVTTWNLGATRIFGFTPAEMIGQPMARLYLPSAIEEERLNLERVRRGEPIPHHESKRVTKDGRVIDVSVSFSPVRDSEGALIGISNIMRNISERKLAEQALAESQKFTERIMNTIPDVVYVYDLSARGNLYINRDMMLLLGYTPESIAAMPSPALRSVMHPDDLERQIRQMDRFDRARDDEIVESEYRFRHADGGYRTFSIRDTIYARDATGRPTQTLGIAQDITARKQSELERSKLMEAIEQSNQELKDFAYVISHDLKAPLRGISSVATWLADDYGDRLDDNGREMLQLLTGRSRRMENLINDILEYSRIGRWRETKTTVNIAALIDEITTFISPPERIKITHDALPVITVEPTRIRQVFQNLIDNAVKFIDKPEGRVHIGFRQDGSDLHFSVEDNGIGIEERHFDKIFQIFQTLEPRNDQAGDSQGTGIGLAIVKRIVENYGGKIWVESVVGQGTTFHFTLPEHIR